MLAFSPLIEDWRSTSFTTERGAIPTEASPAQMEADYDRYAEEYLRRLKPEHFMEATAQATQRKITLESLDLVSDRRPDVQVFSELLVQYPMAGRKRPGQVVPDNMVVIHPESIQASGHFSLALQPAGPILVLDYVSDRNNRKDYDENREKYEEELKVPYYLLFYPDVLDLSLFRHDGKKYVSVLPDENGRHAIPELEMAVALTDGWVRYWFRGELLPLPGDLLRDLDQARQRAEQAERRADEADAAARAMAEQLARLQAELAALRGPGYGEAGAASWGARHGLQAGRWWRTGYGSDCAPTWALLPGRPLGNSAQDPSPTSTCADRFDLSPSQRANHVVRPAS